MANRPSRKTSSRKPTADQAEVASAQRHAPVSLPSGGSFDMATLNKGLDAIVDRDPSNRDAEINKALAAASADVGTSTAAPNALPDHKVYRTETQLSAGTIVGEGKDAEAVGSQVVTEFRQVYDPSTSTTDAPQGVSVSEVDAEAGSRSSVLAMVEVGQGTVKARPDGATDPVRVPATDGATGEPGTTSDADATEQAILAGQQSDGETN